ncbi:hypothetical protein STRIP9103_06181 [Streptomyces ipomoeae 91-03]|uniref:Uncharacterized protein n=1 Tax=Streptomyces ipomoeae 91-03 TaxID=698759 RepID=L1L4K8_9ACTN|nr:hypothetical protein STRIP9103_06181 [Streptomyces ipomoeae 91-03]
MEAAARSETKIPRGSTPGAVRGIRTGGVLGGDGEKKADAHDKPTPTTSRVPCGTGARCAGGSVGRISRAAVGAVRPQSVTGVLRPAGGAGALRG